MFLPDFLSRQCMSESPTEGIMVSCFPFPSRAWTLFGLFLWAVIIGGLFSYSHTHGGHATFRQTSRSAPFQSSGSLLGGFHEDDTWILNAHDHHPLHSPPEASPQAPSTINGLTDQHTVSKFLETRNSEASGGDEEICVVCQDDLISGRIATLDCRHRYHVECIKTWLTLKNFCPICKAVAIRTVDS